MAPFHVDHGDPRFAEVVVEGGVVRAVVRRTHAESLCAGHFPDDPLVPGAYLAGLMADVAALLVARTGGAGPLEAIDECAFARRVVPHETIAIEARFARDWAERRCVDAEVRSAGGRAARARLRFGSAA